MGADNHQKAAHHLSRSAEILARAYREAERDGERWSRENRMIHAALRAARAAQAALRREKQMRDAERLEVRYGFIEARVRVLRQLLAIEPGKWEAPDLTEAAEKELSLLERTAKIMGWDLGGRGRSRG